MNLAAFIFILLLVGCATKPVMPALSDSLSEDEAMSNPLSLDPPLPGAAPRFIIAGGNAQPEVVLQPISDPPPGVVIPISPTLELQNSDYFTATNPAGPWTYRTDDLIIVTNADGTTSGKFANSPPSVGQEFYLIVPTNGAYPLPQNIVTNKL